MILCPLRFTHNWDPIWGIFFLLISKVNIVGSTVGDNEDKNGK